MKEALEEWRAARQAIFDQERAPKECWARLAEAEHVLMQLANRKKDVLMTGPRPFQSIDGPAQAPPIPTEEEYRAQKVAKMAQIEARWAALRVAKAKRTFRWEYIAERIMQVAVEERVKELNGIPKLPLP